MWGCIKREELDQWQEIEDLLSSKDVIAVGAAIAEQVMVLGFE